MPYDSSKYFAQRLLDAGATIVIVMHAHRLQGWTWSGPNGLIVYSLGSLTSHMGQEDEPIALRVAKRTAALLTVDLQRHPTHGGAALSCFEFTPLCLQRHMYPKANGSASAWSIRTHVAARQPVACAQEEAHARGVLGTGVRTAVTSTSSN